MGSKAIQIVCPSCGAKIAKDQEKCAYCGSPVYLKNARDALGVKSNKLESYLKSYLSSYTGKNKDNKDLSLSISFCYMRMKLYDKAISSLETMIEDNPGNPDLYYFEAMCYLRGKKPFLNDIEDIDKAIELLEAANSIEEKAEYHYLLAYIKYDFHDRKGLYIEPGYENHLATANDIGINDDDVTHLFSMLNTEIPDIF